MSKRILVTGGAGFIGSAVVRHAVGDATTRSRGRQADLCRGSRIADAGREQSAAIRSCAPISSTRSRCAT